MADDTTPDDTTPGGNAADGVVLDDGEHDAVVVDAGESDDGAVVIELTVIAGPAKGDVVRLRARGLGDPIDLLGIPATITVRDGAPAVRFEP